jgi:hypothetical protein
MERERPLKPDRSLMGKPPTPALSSRSGAVTSSSPLLSQLMAFNHSCCNRRTLGFPSCKNAEALQRHVHQLHPLPFKFYAAFRFAISPEGAGRHALSPRARHRLRATAPVRARFLPEVRCFGRGSEGHPCRKARDPDAADASGEECWMTAVVDRQCSPHFSCEMIAE